MIATEVKVSQDVERAHSHVYLCLQIYKYSTQEKEKIQVSQWREDSLKFSKRKHQMQLRHS